MIFQICREFIDWIYSPRERRLVFARIVRFGMIATFPLTVWKALMCLTSCESPMVVLLSGSMEPLLKRGYLLVLDKNGDAFRVGEIISFDVQGHEIPIVHRIIKVHEMKVTEKCDILTKGDHNTWDDRHLYAWNNQHWLQRHPIIGKATWVFPYVGLVIIAITENVNKYFLIGFAIWFYIMYVDRGYPSQSETPIISG